MKRLLLLIYSQSGDVARIADAFLEPFRLSGQVEVTTCRIEPRTPFPFPWGTLSRLISVFPECHCGPGPGVLPINVDPDTRFDLVIVAYPIWFLAPALPMQDFLAGPDAKLLADSRVITLCVSQNMWHSGSQTMKRRLRELSAVLLDNVVVTHQGSPLATFVAVPRMLLTGKRDRFLGVFPPAEISPVDLDRVRTLGAIVAEKFPTLPNDHTAPLLRGHGAVPIKRLFILPERLAFHWYRVYSRFVKYVERFGPFGGRLAMIFFVIELFLMLLISLPLILLGSLIAYPFLRRSIDRYAKELAEPSGL